MRLSMKRRALPKEVVKVLIWNEGNFTEEEIKAALK